MTTRRRVLEAAAAAAGAAATDVPRAEVAAQRRRVVALGDRDEGDRWHYDTEAADAHVRGALVNARLDFLCDGPTGIVETLPVVDGSVPLGFEVSTATGECVGTYVRLSADQAEALAVDLLEQAHGARGADE